MSEITIDVRNDSGNPLLGLPEVQEWAFSYINKNPIPNFTIGDSDYVYLQRWFIVPRNPWNNVYLHRFLNSDDDRALHDHPWDNKSWIISGECNEHVLGGSVIHRKAGDIVARNAIQAHRIELISGPLITLFFTGPIIRSWGFYCPQGWRHWRDFVSLTSEGNKRGKGCE
jgi:hypothetical protein